MLSEEVINKKIDQLLKEYGKQEFSEKSNIPTICDGDSINIICFGMLPIEHWIVDGACKYHIINNTEFKEIALKCEDYDEKCDYSDDKIYNKLAYYYRLLGYHSYSNHIEEIVDWMTRAHIFGSDTINMESILSISMVECAKKHNMIPIDIDGNETNWEDIHLISCFKQKTKKYLEVEHCGQCPYFENKQYYNFKKEGDKVYFDQHRCRMSGDVINEYEITNEQNKKEFDNYIYLYNRSCKLIEF